MNILYLMRHAKSSWDDPLLSDRERPLNARGYHDAAEMGRRLAARDELPLRIICSPARRAREMAQRLCQGAGLECPVIEDERLYFQGIEGWQGVIGDIEPSVAVALVIGHNPDYSRFVAWLGADLERDLPTAALARVQWRNAGGRLTPEQIERIELDWPKKA